MRCACAACAACAVWFIRYQLISYSFQSSVDHRNLPFPLPNGPDRSDRRGRKPDHPTTPPVETRVSPKTVPKSHELIREVHGSWPLAQTRGDICKDLSLAPLGATARSDRENGVIDRSDRRLRQLGGTLVGRGTYFLQRSGMCHK